VRREQGQHGGADAVGQRRPGSHEAGQLGVGGCSRVG
jgi:hypothetical protein